MLAARLAILALPLVVVGAPTHAAPPKAPNVGDRAPSLEGVLRADGRERPFAWKGYRGQVIVLSFNASWCAPCRAELPAVAGLMKKRSTFKRRRVRFVTINLDDELDVGRAFIDSLGVEERSFDALYDPVGKVAARYRPRVMPTTYVIDGSGTIRSIHHGYESGDERKLEKSIRAAFRRAK